MRYLLHRSTLASLLLALLFVAEAAPAGSFVLCRAPGDHVALENAVAFERCHTAGAFAPSNEIPGASGLLRAAPPCVDTPVLAAAPPYRQALDATLANLVSPAGSVAIVPPLAAPIPRAVDRSADAASDRMPRLLRSVVLVL
jgi:hypothetical protein